MNVSRLALSLFITGCVVVGLGRVAFAETRIWEAEQGAAKGARLYADAYASGKRCVGVVFEGEKSSGKPIFAHSAQLAPGHYEVTFWIDALPVDVMHDLAFTLRAGEKTVTLHTVHFEGRGGYRPVTLRTRHAGGEFTVGASAGSASGFNGMRAGQGEDEKALTRSAIQAAAKADDATAAWLADFDAITGEQDVRDRALMGHRAWVDKVEVRQLAAYPLPLTLAVDKIHYRPGETVTATYAIGQTAGAPAAPWMLKAELLAELDAVETVWTGRTETREGTFAFTLPAGREFGRELRLRVGDDQTTIGEETTLFGVSSNVYQVGITGRGGPQNTQNYSLERARAEMAGARNQYANYFERFAWAPCDYSDLDPAEELFYSGQTQYPGSRQGIKNLLDAAHEIGIKGITYGKACAGGIAGFNTLQHHPEFFGHSRYGFVSEAMNVFFLERMLANGYNAGSPEDGGWQHWASLWTDWTGNTNTVLFGADAMIDSIKSFGWDGVRWDGHFVGNQKPFLDRLRAFDPGFVHGYNIAFANPGADRFMPPDQNDFHEVAAGGGLMMDESARDWSNTNFSPGWLDRFYDAMCREADYIKAIGGLPLIIAFDMASKQDTHLNILMALAAGQRYTYLTSPGDYAYGPLSKWLTRFSAFIWDQTRRFEEAAVTVALPDGRPLLWENSVWLRHVGGDQWQVLTSIINPPLYQQFCNRVQPPPVTATNAAVTFRPPAGATVTRAFYLSPELAAGWQPLTSEMEDGASVVTLPPLHVFGIAGFTFTWQGDGSPFPLRDPVGEAAVIFAKEAEVLARKAAEAKAKASIGAPVEVPDTPAPRGDDVYLTKHPPPPGWRLERDGKLDVLHARGPFSWLNPVESATALISGARFTPSWVNLVGFKLRDAGCMDEYPGSWDELARYDVIALDNVHARFLGTANRARLATFVREGGGLLVFGGYWNLSCGTDGDTVLADLIPLDMSAYRKPAIEAAGMRLTAAKPAFFEGVDFAALGAVLTCDVSPLRAGGEVLATVDGHPAIVANTAGKGRVLTILINPHGVFPQETAGYWQSVEWLKLINACLRWLGEGADADVRATAKLRSVTPGKAQPEDLLVRAAFGMDAEVFTKQLRESIVNIIDAASARAALEALAENADKISDAELAADVVAAAASFFGKEMASVGEKLCHNALPALRAAGYAILGRSRDPAYRNLLQNGLNDHERLCVREAVAGLGRLGGSESVTSVSEYLARREAGERLLALTTLLSMGDDSRIDEAWAAYEEGLQRAVNLKCGTFQVIDHLWGGTSFKLTPIQRKQGMVNYRNILKLREEVSDDNAFFFTVALGLRGTALSKLAAKLATSEKHEVLPLAFALAGSLEGADADMVRATFHDAKLEAVRLLGEGR